MLAPNSLIKLKTGMIPPITIYSLRSHILTERCTSTHILHLGVIVLVVVKFTITVSMEINFMENITITKP